MSTTKRGSVSLQPEDVLPLFGELFTRSSVQRLIREVAPGKTLYWRILTPLLVLWGLVYQRLNPDHTCDAYISHLHSGAVDALDSADLHDEPLSQRLQSESNSAYVQGRNRLPLKFIQRAGQVVMGYVQDIAEETGRWRGHPVRLLDGTTFRLPPEGDLVSTYGQNSNQQGVAHWVQARALLACDWFSQAVAGVVTAPYNSDETALVPQVIPQENASDVLYVADRNFGIYRVFQVLVAYHYHGLIRLRQPQAQALLKRNKHSLSLTTGSSVALTWSPTKQDQTFADLPTPAVAGRLIYQQVLHPGFRPFAVYLFTTLTAEHQYPTEALSLLYTQRWNVELHFRHVKTSLEMEFFPVRSADLFEKELAAGLLTYNLICVLMTQAALRAQLPPGRLSFQRCTRRILDILTTGIPAHVQAQGQVADWLLSRLAKCKLPNQPSKVPHEPRKVRRIPQIYPSLKGDRASARHTHMQNLLNSDKS